MVGRFWKEIAKDLEEYLDYDNIEVLFSDGEPDLVDALLKPGMRPQRCVLHGKQDFPYILCSDDLKKKEQKPFVDFLKSIPAIESVDDGVMRVSLNGAWLLS